MSEDYEGYYMKGLKRAIERSATQPANTASKSVSIEPALSEYTTVLAKQQATQPIAIKLEFNLEAYRLDIIAKAIAHISNNKKESSSDR